MYIGSYHDQQREDESKYIGSDYMDFFSPSLRIKRLDPDPGPKKEGWMKRFMTPLGGCFLVGPQGETIEVLGFTKNQETLQRKDPHEDPGDFFLLLEEFKFCFSFRGENLVFEVECRKWCVRRPEKNIMFHQPRFQWNTKISLTRPPFGARSCEVAII